jgi:hypothetical protein
LTSTRRAGGAFGPETALKVNAGRRFVGEHLEKLEGADCATAHKSPILLNSRASKARGRLSALPVCEISTAMIRLACVARSSIRKGTKLAESLGAHHALRRSLRPTARLRFLLEARSCVASFLRCFLLRPLRVRVGRWVEFLTHLLRRVEVPVDEHCQAIRLPALAGHSASLCGGFFVSGCDVRQHGNGRHFRRTVGCIRRRIGTY